MVPQSRRDGRSNWTVQLRSQPTARAWHGVARDPIRGCQYVDRAASAGLDVAIELQDAAYDPAAVTPDADEWKYQKRLF